eukprot:6189362-Pleurochrysis_carterae.AAC.1
MKISISHAYENAHLDISQHISTHPGTFRRTSTHVDEFSPPPAAISCVSLVGLFSSQAERVLQLKASTEEVSATLRAANEAKAARQAKLEAARQAEAAAILEAGGNPYQASGR